MDKTCIEEWCNESLEGRPPRTKRCLNPECLRKRAAILNAKSRAKSKKVKKGLQK